MDRAEQTPEGTVTRQFRDLKAGRMEAVDGLWSEYFSRLVAAAQKRLGSVPRRSVVEEDIAISVFQSLCQGAVRGRFLEYHDRDDPWRLLLCLTKQKIVDHIRREGSQKRGEGAVRGESAFLNAVGDLSQYDIEQVFSSEPTLEFLASLAEQHQRLLHLIQDDSRRQVARCGSRVSRTKRSPSRYISHSALRRTQARPD